MRQTFSSRPKRLISVGSAQTLSLRLGICAAACCTNARKQSDFRSTSYQSVGSRKDASMAWKRSSVRSRSGPPILSSI